MKGIIKSLFVMLAAISSASATEVERGSVKQSFSDTMKYVGRGFKSCTDTCIVGKDSYQKVCEKPLVKAWCKKNCEHKKFMLNGKEVRFSVDQKCKPTVTKVAKEMGKVLDDAGKAVDAAIDQFVSLFK